MSGWTFLIHMPTAWGEWLACLGLDLHAAPVQGHLQGLVELTQDSWLLQSEPTKEPTQKLFGFI